MLPASKVHVGAGRDHAVEHLLELADQRYVLGAIVLPQPNHAVEQHEVLRHFALSAVIVVAAAVAHASRRAAAECCLSVCLVRSYSSAAARRSPSLATRNSLRSGETRRAVILRRAPRSSTDTAVFDRHRARALRACSKNLPADAERDSLSQISDTKVQPPDVILESLKSLAHVLFKRTGSLVLCAVFRVLQVGLIKRQKKKSCVEHAPL